MTEMLQETENVANNVARTLEDGLPLGACRYTVGRVCNL